MLDARIVAKRLPSGELLLRDVRVVVKPGEIVALLGASGVGKTSTLRILLGLDAKFDGAVRNDATSVGAVFQEPRLLPWRTVGDNIRLVVPRGRQMPDVAALLRDVGLLGTEAFYPRQLSLGMARRVALARALAIAPDLLILDEPFASLDPNVTASVAVLLGGLRHAGIVVAMHDIHRAVGFATRIVVLADRPATVAHEVVIPLDANETQRAAVRETLMRQFAFASDAAEQDDGGRLAAGAIGG
jgi:NitT/TauT family transport system ATP-binding protein